MVPPFSFLEMQTCTHERPGRSTASSIGLPSVRHPRACRATRAIPSTSSLQAATACGQEKRNAAHARTAVELSPITEETNTRKLGLGKAPYNLIDAVCVKLCFQGKRPTWAVRLLYSERGSAWPRSRYWSVGQVLFFLHPLVGVPWNGPGFVSPDAKKTASVELRPELEDDFERAEPGTLYVINRDRDSSVNLRAQLHGMGRRDKAEDDVKPLFAPEGDIDSDVKPLCDS